jgi:hypothetical protein
MLVGPLLAHLTARHRRRSWQTPSDPVKIYRVVSHMNAWHVFSPATGQAIVSSEDKTQLIDWALQVAQRHLGEVHVCDEAGSVIERRRSYGAGD